MAKFTTFVSEMHTRTVKCPQKQPIKQKVCLFGLGSVIKFSPVNHMPDIVKAEDFYNDFSKQVVVRIVAHI